MASSRIKREKIVVEKTVKLYCKGRHASRICLCNECKDLLSYVKERIDKCIYNENKTVCSKCKLYCYKRSVKEMMKRITKYSSPRMVLWHPIITLRYIIDSYKSTNN